MATQEHLERLVFEIYGAEEGKRKLRELANEHDKAADKHEKASKRQSDAARKAAEETKKTAKIAGAAIAALAALALEASADLETAQGRVERSARKQRITIGELEKGLASADERSRALGAGMIETREHMSALIDVTGQAQEASELYALAVDIAATGDADLAEAVELLTRAHKGEVEELKKLDGITKQRAELLAGVQDETERARMATEMLTEAYSGAADELKDTNTALENLKAAGEEWLAVLGDAGSGMINATAEWMGIVEDDEDLLGQFAGGLREMARQARDVGSNFEALKRFRGQEGGMLGARSFMDFVGEVETERAQARAESEAATFTGETSTGYRIKRTGGRGGYGGDGGGYRDVPREEEKKRSPRRGPREEEEGVGHATLDQAQMFIGGEFSEQSERRDLFAEQARERTRILKEEVEKRRELRNQEIKDRQEADEFLMELSLKTREIEEANTAAKEEKAAKTQEAAMAGVQAGAQLAQSFIKDEGAKAVIAGSMEVARSIAAAASGNIPGSIAHGAAAAQFFAVAAQAGQGAERKGGATGAKFSKGQSRGGESPGGRQRDRDRVGMLGGDRQDFGEVAPVTINISPNLLPHREQVREFTDHLEREWRSRTNNPFSRGG